MLLTGLAVMLCSAQEIDLVPVEALEPVVENEDPAATIDYSTVDEEGRPKRQFLAGLALGSFIGHRHHHHGYYGRPYYGGYGYGRPYYGHHHGYYGG